MHAYFRKLVHHVLSGSWNKKFMDQFLRQYITAIRLAPRKIILNQTNDSVLHLSVLLCRFKERGKGAYWHVG